MPRKSLDSRDELPVLIAELADLYGRAMEINSRIGREAHLLAETHQRTALTLGKLAQVLASPASSPTAPTSPPELRILRTAEAARRIGLSKSSLWRMVKEGKFPKPRLLSPHAVGWLESEIAQWLDERKAPDATAGLSKRRQRH